MQKKGEVPVWKIKKYKRRIRKTRINPKRNWKPSDDLKNPPTTYAHLNKLNLYPLNGTRLRELMHRYGHKNFLFKGMNENGERTLIVIMSDAIHESIQNAEPKCTKTFTVTPENAVLVTEDIPGTDKKRITNIRTGASIEKKRWE